MSEARDLIQSSVLEREVSTSELCRDTTDGSQFSAEVDPISDIELNGALGRDERESVKIYVSNKAVALRLMSQDFVEILLYGRWNKFRIVRRKNNPASPQVEFGLAVVLKIDN